MSPSIEYRIGDVFQRLAEIPDGSIDLVLTSPPFLALRSYLPADHPDKQFEIGSEPDPASFIDTMLRLTVEWRRVLAPHGSICIELGDTYSGGSTLDKRADDEGRVVSSGPNAYSEAHKIIRSSGGLDMRKSGHNWPLPKSLCSVPWLYSLSLAYGRNLLNHEHTIDPWRVRNVIAWCRPNPPVGALGDKFRPATSYMTIACVGQKRYFDLDAVRTEHAGGDLSGGKVRRKADTRNDNGTPYYNEGNPAGAPPLDYWEIPTQPYKGSHYATWPEALLERPIKAMCPAKVCTVCGKPSERITELAGYVDSTGAVHDGVVWGSGMATGRGAHTFKLDWTKTRQNTTLGWSDCGHDAWRTGVVLDPFGGSGTTLAVAQGLGRSAIGIDLDARNADLARERVGMFLEVTA